MPKPKEIAKAFLQKIGWNEDGDVVYEAPRDEWKKVQFNPESLTLTFSNQLAGGDQSGGAAIQFASRGTTKLSFDLLFDVSAPKPNNRDVEDVRKLTKDIADFMATERQERQEDDEVVVTYVPPGVRFQWGTFKFEGVMESINETLEFFSEEGKPLRASVGVGLMKQDVDIKFAEADSSSRGAGVPGTQPLTPARDGDSVQSMAARAGNPQGWVDRALANDIENPRIIPPGTLLR